MKGELLKGVHWKMFVEPAKLIQSLWMSTAMTEVETISVATTLPRQSRPQQEIGKGKLWPAKSNGARLAIILRRPLVLQNASKP